MVWKTGSSSPGELEMTFNTSDVAVCCSSDSESSRARCCSASNKRTFSIAMSACSANVCKAELVALKTASAQIYPARARQPASHREAEEPRVQPAIPPLTPIRASTPGLQARPERVRLHGPRWPGQRDVSALASLTAESPEFDP